MCYNHLVITHSCYKAVWKPKGFTRENCFQQISRYRWLKSKNFKKQSGFIFEFCFWEDPPHPVNWSPTHSTGPKTPFFTDISVSVAQIEKFQKARWFYFLILLLGGPSPPSQLVPNPFNWSPNNVFYRYLCIGRSNLKNSKSKVVLFSNFACPLGFHTAL